MITVKDFLLILLCVANVVFSLFLFVSRAATDVRIGEKFHLRLKAML